ncbi:hypothetical protein PSTG_04181 [Puccinia striiformis f. sp. tritici PST-78]|uniref:Uncharacterized protein n=1 Tax=Puccinia striiformis f. sp. tritici PST-78 TaxID=1165861 RepID=A0A0L0VTH6_9BASI|nr:hypothetical protein PSTG_04181 [Puccinia striiformis f. sp. tritici PST-78]
MSGQINIPAPAKTYITDRHRPLNYDTIPLTFQTQQTSTGSVTNPSLTTEMERVILELSILNIQ